MTANTNPETNIPYGIVSSNVLNSDLVDALLFDGFGVENFVDHSWEDAKQEAISEYRREHEDTELDDDEIMDEINTDCWDFEETIVSGVLEGVTYQSTYIGGALNFWIFHSPVVTDKACQCSPCVPGAGNLDSLKGSYTAYGIPDDWRIEDETLSVD